MWLTFFKRVYRAFALLPKQRRDAVYVRDAPAFVTKEQLERLADRVATMETQCTGIRSKEAIYTLKVELSELRGDLKETNARLQAVAHQSQLLLEKVVNRSE